MAKLHELLAVESDLESVAKKTVQEARKTFKEKPNFFIKQQKEVKMFDEGAKAPPIETTEMTTTVHDKLKYVMGHFTKYLDAIAQKERTNQEAKADLVVDGETLAKDVPATLLLGLESRLKLIRDMCDEIPTLPPGGKWVKSDTDSPHVYYNEHDDVRFKTAKTFEHRVLYDATKEHPAQIEKWEEQKNVGEIIVKTWSGMISPKEKADLLGRIDALLRGVKKARQRANSVDVVDTHIGKILAKYILGK